MPYLLDTCVLSEPTRKAPNPRVIAFLEQLDYNNAYLSVITCGELWKGIQKLSTSRRRTALEAWFRDQMLPQFPVPPLPVDMAVAYRWGRLMASLELHGLTPPLTDSLIAATALAHNLTLVTRNESDFAHTGVSLLNPWR